MLIAEEAAARLTTLRDPAWRESAGRRVTALPRPLREPAAALLSASPSSTDPEVVAAHRGRRLAAAATLDELSAAARGRLLSALHPGLGPALARWWTDGHGRPYLRGWTRKAFRILGAPQVTRAARLDELTQLLTLTGPYDADPQWLAIWGGYRLAPRHYWPFGPKVIGDLLASAIDLGGPSGDETLSALLEIGNGEHPTGMMGRHVIVALLGAARPEGWEFTERLLLAAQRQEGLRQSILESVDEAHPAAFDRMLAVVIDNRLLRFAAAVRAAGVWLGFGADVTQIPLVEQRVRALAAYRAEEWKRSAALDSGDPWDVYVALCAGGMRDAAAAIGEARAVLAEPGPASTADLRAVAIRFAAATALASGQELITAAVDDPDLRVAALAAALLSRDALGQPGAFDALTRLANRLPAAAREVPGLGVEQTPVTLSRTATAGLLVQAVGDRPVADLLPWLPVMDAGGRARAAGLITGAARPQTAARGRPGEARTLPASLRPVVIGLLTDRSSHVRGIAIEALTRTRLDPADAPAIEALLTRAASDVRRGALTMLASLPSTAARASAARLAASKDQRQRTAAAELLRVLGPGPSSTVTSGSGSPNTVTSGTVTGAPMTSGPVTASSGTASSGTASPVTASPVTAGAATAGAVSPGVGVGRPEDLRAAYLAGRSEPARPRQLARRPRPDRRSAHLLREIDQIASRHRDVPVTLVSWQGEQEMLFGDIRFFPAPFDPRPRTVPGSVGTASASTASASTVPASSGAAPADPGSRVDMVLGEIFRDWWASRPGALRGPDDARDALRAHALAASLPVAGDGFGLPPGSVVAMLVTRAAGADAGQDSWWRDLLRDFAGDPPDGLVHPVAVRHVTSWLVVEHANGPVIDESLDAIEAFLASVPRHLLAAPAERSPRQIQSAGKIPPADWRNRLYGHPWHALLSGLLRTRPGLFTAAQIERWYRLMRWVERPVPEAQPLPVSDELLAVAHAAGVASDADVAVTFLYPHNAVFRDLTRYWRGKEEARYPHLVPIADQVREQVVAIEAERGDLPTATSAVAVNVSGVPGVKTAARLLGALGKTPLARGHGGFFRYTGANGRADALSHLLRVSFPARGETGADLKSAAAEARVPEARLVDLALYAPQWAAHVEDALGWPGLADGVLWLHAHTKDRRWSVDAGLRDSWAAQIAERTPLSTDDLADGAVDVDWFRRAHTALGRERWAVLHKAARHASSGTGHRRAQLYAGAMLGTLTPGELRSRIVGKRDQDAVRALGLLPLPSDESGQGVDGGPEAGRRPDAGCGQSGHDGLIGTALADIAPADTGLADPGQGLGGEAGAREQAIAVRYAILREFELGSKAFGAQRQASERTAVRIGVSNLARTAGYPDPLRFTWAVEARQAADLADGRVSTVSVSTVRGDVAVTLSVTAEGTPELTAARAGRPLKSVPAALRKDPDVAALQARKSDLAKQATRVRASLEAAMVAQDAFTPADLAGLRHHPVVAPMLAALVWVTEDGVTRLLGNGFGALPDDRPGGSRRAPAGPLRIAHPVHFLADGTWVAWQERLFKSGQRQPFKQVFRELYVPTEEEVKGGPLSHRYDGHQIQPRQALALLSSRGWVASHESGDASRSFHSCGLVARVMTDTGFLTAAEADLPSIGGVSFTRRGDYLAQPLESVPRVVFSEAMRDLDLLVSVAHAGGVDPEATASTTEMRAALVRETARLLKLGNIGFAGQHAVITGRLGEYSVHLGSGTVHRRPGGAVCIIPVGSQHRGRLFLPFADDDPKTAEIVAKVLLLARDHEIKDPAILEQLR